MRKKNKKTLIVVLISIFALSNTFALTKEELNKMPKDKVNQLPVIEVMSIEGMSLKKQFLFLILENAFIDLRYLFKKPSGSPSKELTKAIMDFQTDIGNKPTGILTVSEFTELKDRHDATNTIPIYISSQHVADIGNTVEAVGTWDSEENAFPLQLTKLRCFEQSMDCVLATAVLSVPTNGSNNQGSLRLELDFITVTRWDELEIHAEIKNSKCVSYTLIIVRKSKEVFQIRRGKGLEGCEGIATSPVIIRLKSGFSIAYEFWKKQNKKQKKYLSSNYQKWMKSISTKTK